ncbi:adenylate/guanylate cyclase domain-containing protein [Pseudorhodoplanes sp.]|uniref:adenylate/guanylate cyclase domain-containing protein n=1 Tax=Pseudorhodoplanes sp. TaxID=1934341 RepID=UPI002B704453|nr:adenylate/guanylate cyclase domain-containing protein [Pseudorhodoplanes sp.]HWV40324.1 adenylate/guanylate cyclase domain-containing protein [Pseudorhodoplanes sp.]
MTERADSESARLHNALRAHLRQDFVAPAAAIVGFADIVIEDAEQAGLSDYRADLERIRTAGLSLQALLDDVLSQSGEVEDIASYRSKLRHDLRTPINAVKGYGEMIVEDARDAGHDSLLPDLQKLLAAADGMLARIDALVAFSGETSLEEASQPSFAEASRVVDALRVSHPTPVQQQITGQILVIDDNASNRDLLARQLARDGHAVETAESGREGLAMAHERSFDLILLDVLMPEMSGFEVLGTLKEDKQTTDIPVIMISALDEMDSIVRCIEAGAVDYLPKPFAPALLRARIRASLENKLLRDRERAMMHEIRLAKERNETLLLSILPRAVVDRINGGAGMVADHIPEATIVFADIVNFTPFSGQLTPADVVGVLNRIFSAFDRLVDQHRAEKIKTIGDGYMVAVGIPEPCDDHVAIAARLSLTMMDRFAEIRRDLGAPIDLRIGVHTGPAIAGVIGERKFAYDIWGTTVNIASRMESHGAPGHIHVSKAVADRVAGQFRFVPRGAVEVKGAGLMETFWLEGEA